MTHACHAPHCTVPVPPHMLACRAHWFALPKAIRDAVWREYRAGQERTKTPSLRYLAVQRLACAYLAFKPRDEAAACEVAELIRQAIGYQQAAIAAGQGDPLAGLVPAERATSASAT